MTSQLDRMRVLTERVKLNVGDVVVDLTTGYAGTLVKRVRHISIEYDDVYVWEVKWFESGDSNLRPADYLEEEGLKLSIIAGTCEWHSVKKRY